jgi:hypothetical protein
MTDHDPETGEVPVYSNGVKAASATAAARVQMDRDRMGYGANILHDAIARALAEIPVWIKSEKEGNRAKYAPLKDILTVVRPALAKYGVRIRQGADRSWSADEGGGVKGRLIPVYTDLIHTTTGQLERTQIEIPLTRLDPQAMGSAVTYGRRYTLIAALGLATDEADDDGARAQRPDITAKVDTTAECEAIAAEIRGAKDLDALTKFATDGKTRKRIDGLTDAEQEKLRVVYSDARERMGK